MKSIASALRFLSGIMRTCGRRAPALGLVPLVMLLVAEPAAADKRVALVVGNSAYQHVSRLDSPAQDARLMADVLLGAGFTLVGGAALTDLDKVKFDSAVQNFAGQMAGADVALFYYAGHGLNVRGSNHLVPVNANPTEEADIGGQMVDVAPVLRQMEASGTTLNVVLLDACRNNPFAGRGLVATGGGLAPMRAPENTLIAYAAQPGSVAQDGAGGDSPYAKALAQSLRRPGLGILEVFDDVGLAVKRSTGGAQQPWVSFSPIDGSFAFIAAPAQTPPNAPRSASDEAAQAWAATKDTTNRSVLEAFIQRYGTSFYATLARARLDELRARVTKPPPVAVVWPPVAALPKQTGGDHAGQRAVLYDEDPAEPKGRQYVGMVLWRTEQIEGLAGQPGNLAVRADVEIPDRKFKMTMSFRLNTDPALPASHTAQMTFVVPPDSAGGGVQNLPGMLMKSNEQARGTPLAGLAVKIVDDVFLVGLSNVQADRARNLQLLKERSWIDIPLVYKNQRRAILAIEKGPPGDRAFSDAFAAWGQSSVADQTNKPSAEGSNPIPDARMAEPPAIADVKPADTAGASVPDDDVSAKGTAVYPTAISPNYSSEEGGRARLHTCVDQFNANKATHSNGGLRWIERGGGYYVECNRRLKG
jgi:Caspase domain